MAEDQKTKRPKDQKTILVTGSAGFIGFHVANRFLQEGHEVVGLDSINDYYNPQLKLARLGAAGIQTDIHQWGEMVQSKTWPNYRFIRTKLEDKEVLYELFKEEKFDQVIHLAAQPGVRYSLENPGAYIESNIVGFLHILEACRHYGIKHLVYASSSSVYGNSANLPLSVTQNVDYPVSLYAATKKSNELMAHTYSHLFGIPVTGLRFFTVYGPWGRPDMATHLFADAILKGKPIKVFNNGQLSRDFTYVSDIAEGVFLVSQKAPTPLNNREGSDDGSAGTHAAYRVYNIGNSAPVQLIDFIETLEQVAGREAIKEYLPMQPGDVKHTYADITGLQRDFGYTPNVSIRDGLESFVEWFVQYYSHSKV